MSWPEALLTPPAYPNAQTAFRPSSSVVWSASAKSAAKFTMLPFRAELRLPGTAIWAAKPRSMWLDRGKRFQNTAPYYTALYTGLEIEDGMYWCFISACTNCLFWQMTDQMPMLLSTRISYVAQHHNIMRNIKTTRWWDNLSTTDVILMIHNKCSSFLPSFLGSKVALTNITTCKDLTYNKNVHIFTC